MTRFEPRDPCFRWEVLRLAVLLRFSLFEIPFAISQFPFFRLHTYICL